MIARKPKMALSLAGGGVPGWLYEIGVLTALDDFLGEDFSVTDFDIFVGTSAGAVACALLVNDVSPDAIYKSVLKHQQTYLSLQRSDFYSVSMRNLWDSFTNLVKHVFKGIGRFIRHPFKFSFFDLVFEFQESLPPGVFSMENFHRFVDFVMTKNRLKKNFQDLKKEFYVTATELDTGDRFVFGRGFVEDVPIPLAITASSAVPLFFKPVNVKGHDLVDGGVGRVAHVDVAVARGAKLIFVVNPIVPIRNDRNHVQLTDHRGTRKGLYMREKGPAKIADQIFRIDTVAKLKWGMEAIKAADPDLDVILIQPAESDTLMFSASLMSFGDRINIIQRGYQDAMEYFHSHFEQLQHTFGKFGIAVTLKNFETDKIWRAAEAPENQPLKKETVA